MHADGAADAAAGLLQARAFTTNNHIAFAAGEYAPHTQSGRELLLHELTHVVQQEHAPSATPYAQLQAKQTTSNPGDLLHAQFQKLLQQKAAREKINAPVAHAIAKAYVDRPKPQRNLSLHATQYTDDRTAKTDEPSEAEVYAAIVDALDVTMLAGNVAAVKWRPHIDPNEGRREDAPKEIANWAIGQAIDMATDKLVDTTLECVATWLGAAGLWTVIGIARGGAAKDTLEMGIAIGELIETLKKPVKRPLYKYEQILADVIGWMAEEQGKAAAAERAAHQEPRSIAPPDELRVVNPRR